MDGLKAKLQWRKLARLFTRPVVAAMARNGSAQPLWAALRVAGVVPEKGAPLSSLLNECLQALHRNYRCEYVYKAAIGDRVVFGRHSPRTASLHVEQHVGDSIVDLAVFNGTSTAYEIKTEFDSDRRLVSQASNYLKTFEQVYLVTHPGLAERYLRVAHPDVGVLALNARGSLTTVRAAITGIERLDKAALFRMLRAAEFQAAVRRLCGPQPEVPNVEVRAHYGQLWATLSIEQAHRAYVSAMQARTTQPAVADFVSALPSSMRVLGYATPLSAVQRQRILNIFH